MWIPSCLSSEYDTFDNSELHDPYLEPVYIFLKSLHIQLNFYSFPHFNIICNNCCLTRILLEKAVYAQKEKNGSLDGAFWYPT